MAANPTLVRYRVRDDTPDVLEEQRTGGAWRFTGNHWDCDNFLQAEQVAARLRCGEAPWGEEGYADAYPVHEPGPQESFWRRVALAGEWDDDAVPF